MGCAAAWMTRSGRDAVDERRASRRGRGCRASWWVKRVRRLRRRSRFQRRVAVGPEEVARACCCRRRAPPSRAASKNVDRLGADEAAAAGDEDPLHAERLVGRRPELRALSKPCSLELAVRAARSDRLEARAAAPVEQLARAPSLPGDARREAERLARARDVGGAVPDVAEPELAGDVAAARILAAGERARACGRCRRCGARRRCRG